MYCRKIVLFFVSTVAILLIFPGKVMAEPHTRSSWYIGFGEGGAIDANFNVNGNEISFKEWSPTGKNQGFLPVFNPPNFKVGFTLSPKTLLGYDYTLAYRGGIFVNDIYIRNDFLMLTYFPSEEGFFLRAGGGLSEIYMRSSKPSNTARGYGALAGAGYALWLGKTFNLTLNIDHSRQFYPSSSINPESSNFTILYVGFDWY